MSYLFESREHLLKIEKESLQRDNDYLRAELDKTKKIIDIVHRMQLGQQLDVQLFEALKEYRGGN